MSENRIKFKDLEKLPPHRFDYDGQVRRIGIAPPLFFDRESDAIQVTKGWQLLGWSDELPARLMHGREGQIAILLWHPEHGEVWEHYPLFEDADRSEVVFSGCGKWFGEM